MDIHLARLIISGIYATDHNVKAGKNAVNKSLKQQQLHPD